MFIYAIAFSTTFLRVCDTSPTFVNWTWPGLTHLIHHNLFDSMVSGSPALLCNVLKNVCEGQKHIKIAFHGGSVSYGIGSSDYKYGRDDYVSQSCVFKDGDLKYKLNSYANLIMNWMKQTWSQTNFTCYLSSWNERWRRKYDICIIEMAINSKDATALEDFIRMCRESEAAIIALNWIRHISAPEVERDMGIHITDVSPNVNISDYDLEVAKKWDEEWFNRGNHENFLRPTLDYYNIPVISFRAGLVEHTILSRDSYDKFYAPDKAHPNDLGHSFMASSFITMFLKCYDELSPTLRDEARLAATILSEEKPSDPFQILLEMKTNNSTDLRPLSQSLMYSSTMLDAKDLFDRICRNSGDRGYIHWNITKNEHTAMGNKRQAALFTSTINASIAFSPINILPRSAGSKEGLIVASTMTSYMHFGNALFVVSCNGSSARRSSVISGWHSDHSSLAVSTYLSTGIGECVLNITNLGGKHGNNFKLLSLQYETKKGTEPK